MDTSSFVDLRRSRRGRAVNSIHVAVPFENHQIRHEVVTMDESLHGIRIRTIAALSPGEKIVVFLQGESQAPTTARVVWVRRQEISAGYVAGLEFNETKPELGVPECRRANT